MGAIILNRRGFSQFIHEVDRRARILDPEPPAGKDFPIDHRMEVGEASGKFELFPVDGDGTERGLPFLCGLRGRSSFPTERNQRTFAFSSSRKPAILRLSAQVHLMVLHTTENPYQHVEEVNTDIGGDPAGFARYPPSMRRSTSSPGR